MMHEKGWALVVLPVGLKANWSEMTSGSVAGKSHFLTTNFSASRERMGVSEMGR